MYSSEYTSGFSAPAASQFAAPPSPHYERQYQTGCWSKPTGIAPTIMGLITPKTVAEKIADHLHYELSLDSLVVLAESALDGQNIRSRSSSHYSRGRGQDRGCRRARFWSDLGGLRAAPFPARLFRTSQHRRPVVSPSFFTATVGMIPVVSALRRLLWRALTSEETCAKIQRATLNSADHCAVSLFSR